MTLPELYLLMPQLCEQLKRIESQNTAIIKVLATERWRERGKAAQELRRLREQVAKLEAEKGVRQALTDELARTYGEPKNHNHEAAVKRDFKFSQKKPK